MKRVLLSLAICAGFGSAEAAPLVLENEALAIHFSQAGSGFAVTSVVNRLVGASRFVETNLREPDFWEIRLVNDEGANPHKAVRLYNHTPSRVRRVEKLADGFVFVWEGISIPGGETNAVDVRAQVRLPAGTAASEWTLSVVNRSKTWALHETRYPVLTGVVKTGEADVLMPFKNMGARLHRAYDIEKGAMGTFGFPGWYPPVAAYLKDGGGLYLAAHDAEARNKSLVFSRGAKVEFVTPVENAGVPGRAAEGPRYPVVLAAFAGDWWQAAWRYRAWATRQKWCAKGMKAQRADYPRRLAELDLWLLGGGLPSTVSNTLEVARNALPGLNLGFHWYSWNVQPFDTHYPEYFPKVGVKEVCGWAAQEGFLVMPYINGRLWDMGLASYPYARAAVCGAPGGGVRREHYNNRDFGVMCPAAAPWQETLRFNATNVVFGLNAGALYYDQITCSRPQLCRNPAHGHPLEGGSWWADGYRAALVPIHADFAEKGVPLTSEGAAETWLDVVDGYLIATLPMADDVPFYPAVYSGYATYYGARVHIRDTPASFFAAQARALLWGVIPGWNYPWTFTHANRRDAAEALRIVGNARHAAREFLGYGTLEDELRPIDPLPTVAMEWSETRNGKVTLASQPKLAAIVGTVWKNAAGTRTAVMAVNVSEKPQTVRFRLPTGVKALAPKPIPGLPPPTCAQQDGVVTLTLAPRGIAFLAS